MPRKSKPSFDELFLLRVDSSGRPRGARFTKLEDKVASAAVDMKCRVLLSPPADVCRLAMKLPEGRLSRGTLVMPRIARRLYDEILNAAMEAERHERVKMRAAIAREPEYIKAMIALAEAALARIRRKSRNT